MALMEVAVEDRDVLQALSALGRQGADLTEAMSAIGFALAENVRLGFAMGRDPYGRPWAPLKSRGGQPLRNTGGMMNGISHRAARDEVEVGSSFKWAATHQFGATIRPVRARWLRFYVGGAAVFAKKVEIPARPFLPLAGLPADWREDVLSTLAANFVGKWK